MPAKLDTKEFEMPETVFSRDIETRVIQTIILHCLNRIDSVGFLEGNLIGALMGRDIERVSGIFVEQDSKNHVIKVRIEINVEYGVSIPQKAEEVQLKIVQDITKMTGLHVASVHVVIKGLMPLKDDAYTPPLLLKEETLDEYSDRF